MLPLATIGCQSTHVASTAPSEPVSCSNPKGPAIRSRASRVAGHDVAEALRNVGHGVAEALRQTYSVAANGVRESGSSIVDITTNGAQKVRNSRPESLTAPVIDVDAAMQARDWDQVTATYSSGATVAGPTGFRYVAVPRPERMAVFLYRHAVFPWEM